MKTVEQTIQNIIERIPNRWKTSFCSVLVFGIVTHLQMIVSDVPNHDGLNYIHDSLNIVTSGRWFLTVASGISSYYTLPWLTAILGFLALGAAACLLTDVLELSSRPAIVLCSGLLASFPAIASTIAYIFTFDGYMISVLLAIAAVYCVGKFRFGWIWGAVCLALSMGIYQAYLAVAILLCIYRITVIADRSGNAKEGFKEILRYLYMGILGAGLYFVILKLLLVAEHLVLDDYQGINNLGASVGIGSLPGKIVNLYKDFVVFCLRSKVLASNVFAAIALLLVVIAFVVVFCVTAKQKGWLRKPWFYVIVIGICAVVPIVCGMITLISAELNFHLIMRFHYVLLPIMMIAFTDRYSDAVNSRFVPWALVCGAAVLIFTYMVADNVGYFNLQKRYEKSYAYCVRLLDRIEQTEGYYPGIPIAMIGVVSTDQYPSTDITTEVTGSMIGLEGDFLYYKSADYETFMRVYLGATLNFLPQEAMSEIYYTDEYMEMSSFPSADSIRIVNGIMYIKTENTVE